MERVAVQSTDIAIVGYDAAQKLLEVAFRNGSVYHYEGVPKEQFTALCGAASVGLYYGENIKSNYPYKKIH